MTGAEEPRDCTHQRVRHQHGTRAAYVADHCHCSDCTQANRAASQQRRRALTHGTWRPYRSGTTAARHVRRLLAAGLTITDIAVAADVARSTVRALTRVDAPSRIRTATHLALLSVERPVRRRGRKTPPPHAFRQAARLRAVDSPAAE